MSGFALLLATLSVLATTVTPNAAQSLTCGPVMIETHHTDLAGNIRLSTNEAGDVTQRLDYAPFGEVDGRSCTGDDDPTRSPQFQGTLRDPKTCLDDFGARDYYMVTGRFPSVDPVLPIETALRDPQQWNRYAYARNNQLIYTDPDGRVVWWNVAAAGGAACGGAAQVAENLVTGRDWHDGVARAAGIGAITNVVGLGAFRGAASIAGHVISRVSTPGSATDSVASTVTIDSNKLIHIFDKAGHKLDTVVKAAGSRETAFRALEIGAQSAVDAGKLTGTFQVVVNVGGIDVTVRGVVIDGVARIGAAFLR